MLNAIYDAKQELHIINDKSLEELFNIIKKDIPGCEIIKLNNSLIKLTKENIGIPNNNDKWGLYSTFNPIISKWSSNIANLPVDMLYELLVLDEDNIIIKI